MFWNEHASTANFDLQSLSSEVIDLITCLISRNPVHRFTLSEIMTHPWYTQNAVTSDEIIEEFTNRRDTIEGDNIQTNLDSETYTVDQTVFTNNSVSRGL